MVRTPRLGLALAAFLAAGCSDETPTGVTRQALGPTVVITGPAGSTTNPTPIFTFATSGAWIRILSRCFYFWFCSADDFWSCDRVGRRRGWVSTVFVSIVWTGSHTDRFTTATLVFFVSFILEVLEVLRHLLFGFFVREQLRMLVQRIFRGSFDIVFFVFGIIRKFT